METALWLNDLNEVFLSEEEPSEFKGTKGIWRTTKGGRKIFIPGDGSAPIIPGAPETAQPPPPAESSGKKPFMLIPAVAAAVKGMPENTKKFFTDEKFRKEATVKMGEAIKAAPKKIAQRAVQALKMERDKWVNAGKALKKIAKGEKLETKDKWAIFGVAMTVGLTAWGGYGAGKAAQAAWVGTGESIAGEVFATSVGKKFARNVVFGAALKTFGITPLPEAKEVGAHAHAHAGVHEDVNFLQEALNKDASEEELIHQAVEKITNNLANELIKGIPNKSILAIIKG